MKERGPLRILFVGTKDIGLLIGYKLNDQGCEDEVVIAPSVSSAIGHFRKPGCNFNLLLIMNRINEVDDAAQDVIQVAWQVCPDMKIIQIGGLATKNDPLFIPPDRVWEISFDFSELLKSIDELFS